MNAIESLIVDVFTAKEHNVKYPQRLSLVLLLLAFLPGCLNCLAMADCNGMHRVKAVDENGTPVVNLHAIFIMENGEEHTFICPDEDEFRCGEEGTIQLYFNGDLTLTADDGSSTTVSLVAGAAETCGCPKMVEREAVL